MDYTTASATLTSHQNQIADGKYRSDTQSRVHSLHRQTAHSSALATRLDKGPVRNSGSAEHWTLSVAGSIPVPYRTPGLCHLPNCNGAEETAEHLVL